MSHHPNMPAPESLAERFKILMRSPGRTRTIEAANVVAIETDEGEPRVMANVRAACQILGVTNSTERRGDVYRVTLLETR